MKSIPMGLRFQIFALALAGFSIFIFVALISPYTQTRVRMKLLQPQIRAAVAAERFERYSALEIKEAIDYGLIEEGEDREEELQNHAEDLQRWQLEAAEALSDLRFAQGGALKAAKNQQQQDNRLFFQDLERDYMNLAPIEQRLHDMAANSAPRKQLAALVQTE